MNERENEPSQTPAVPRHVAIIMDGNGRWAERQGLPRGKGHEEGAESVRAVMRAARDTGVEYLTLYAFSVENWIRPRAEIDGLMRLLSHFLKQYEHELHENEVRLRVIGEMRDLPESIQSGLSAVMERTSNYQRQLILALSYGSRTELTQATRRIAEGVRSGEIAVDDINEDMITANLYAPDVPDPDLMIRTSGEMRLSNFLLWQLSYAELYITEVLWPEFREPEFREAIAEFGRRRRRFGDIK